MIPRYPFITGSHAYGRPTPDSDVDLVLRLEPKVIALLRKLSDENVEHDDEWHIIRFGKLNIVACDNDEDFEVWWDGTQECKRDPKGKTKKAARVIFDRLRQERGCSDNYRQRTNPTREWE